MEKYRIIAHLDIDAFFASVEERDNPSIRGLPVAVGSDPKEGAGRGVVSTANYEARKYGIHSALPVSRAWRLSEAARKKGLPAVVFIAPDFKKYEKTLKAVMEIIRKYSSHIEQASIDEAYFDLSCEGGECLNFISPRIDADHWPQKNQFDIHSPAGCGHTRINADMKERLAYKKAKEMCGKIKAEIKKKEKITASIGIGPNKLIAKLASDYKKPDGLTIIMPNQVEEFIFPMSVRKLPGIGPKTEAKLASLGIKTILDLQKLTKEKLGSMLGKWGEAMYEKSRGRDFSPIVEEHEAKSIGEQETFDMDTLDSGFIFQRFKELCESVIGRLGKGGGREETFRTIIITARFSDFETKTRSRTLKEPANSFKILYSEVMKLALPFFDKRENPGKKLIRMIGVRVTSIKQENKKATKQ
ncbi:hypothetical protein A2Y83_02540 [Candidatus Falkowbacteria bacterium RBG_13_39_14]|uniref:DNA polymerase IV n=1 Tax=Candidatus Falkowbacteria bacterium RBG_13_39_14 TaxID=1797985 RepID=A0A1F5S3T1_9BACT|nr:MAG: hypothetical protein A2Y83_02540 [Candidatus Falkowbacteria bacterium RBG_13_39_14]